MVTNAMCDFPNLLTVRLSATRLRVRRTSHVEALDPSPAVREGL